MSAVATSDLKQLFWNVLYWEKGTGTLLDAIKTLCRFYYARVKLGSQVIGTSATNRSVTLMVDRRFSIMEAAELSNRLWKLYNETVANLASAGTTSPTDDQIYLEGSGLLEPITESYNDFSYLRTGFPTETASSSSSQASTWRVSGGRLYERNPNGGPTPWHELLPLLQDGQLTFEISPTGVA